MSRSRSIAGTVLAVALAAGLASCSLLSPGPAPTPEVSYAPTGDGVLRIGTLFTLTGTAAATGPAQVAGVELAARDIAIAGGVGVDGDIESAPVEVLHRDATDDEAGALAAFAELVDLGVDVVIGPSSTALAAALAPAAVEAGIPLISPSASRPGDVAPDTTLFSLAPAADAAAEALATALADAGASRVLLVAAADAALAAPLEAAGLTVEQATPAGLAAALPTARPDAIVLDVPAAEVPPLVTTLAAAGHGPEKLWFTTENTVTYTKTLSAGALAGSHGVLAGADVDEEFATQLRLGDPGLASTRFAAEAYDATVLAALAAVVAGDDGGPAIGRGLRAVASGGIPCSSFGECVDVLGDRDDIDYVGMSGPVDLDASGGMATGAFTTAVYSAQNSPTPAQR